MDMSSLLYLGVTFGMLVVFALIVYRTYRPGNRDKKEAAKYNMMHDDAPEHQDRKDNLP
jgi:cbb3-type cytochrome oxidase subunit 3